VPDEGGEKVGAVEGPQVVLGEGAARRCHGGEALRHAPRRELRHPLLQVLAPRQVQARPAGEKRGEEGEKPASRSIGVLGRILAAVWASRL